MGSKNCPETPRQKMIGMMYLVLTALLALNVSKEILNAFITVNDAMVKTNTNFEGKIGDTYEKFRKAAEASPDKIEPYYKRALQIQTLSNELVGYMENVKNELFSKVDGVPIDEVKKQGLTLTQLSSKDNYDKATNYFLIKEQKAYEMMKKFNEYKKNLVKTVADTGFTMEHGIITSNLQVDGKYKGEKDKIEKDWAVYNFEGTVAAACFTLLNKMIGEIRNVEFETVDYIFKSVDAGYSKFDVISAKVIPYSRMVFAGDAYEADVIVAAYDSKQNPTGYLGQGRDTVIEEQAGSCALIEGHEGVVKLKIPTSNVGDQKFAGLIKIKGPDGLDKFFGFKSSYTVTKPAAAVAAEKMNVFYAGIPNPVAIAAPVAPEKLRINWGGASARQTAPGKFDVDVPTTLAGREITIDVSAEIDKKTTSMGKTIFRVKTVPEPTIYIGGNITGGKQAKDAIMANPFVSARMSPDFNYELKWTIVSYKVTFVKNGVEEAPISINGPQFGPQVSGKIQSASTGTIVEFSDIVINSIAGRRPIQKVLSIRIR